MGFSFTFPQTRAGDEDDEPTSLTEWLTGQGEPFEVEDGVLRLRALPVRLTEGSDGLKLAVDLRARVPLARLIGLLYELALWLGTDVHLGGRPVDRGTAWIRLADEQDRLRIADAIDHAGPRTDEVLAGLWQVLRACGRKRDLRWDPRARAIVEVGMHPEVIEDATTMATDDTDPGALIAWPVHDGVHILAWRWLAETWPAFSDGGPP